MRNIVLMNFIFFLSGFILYFCYGYQHSTEGIRPADKQEGEYFIPETPDFESVVNKPQIH